MSETLRGLETARALSSKVLVAYSGGKDSRVVMDLAKRAFPKVEAFFMYFVPGLRYYEEQLAWATDHWRVVIHQYPHWSALNALKYGVYCDAPASRDRWPDVRILDSYSYAMADTGIPIMMTGAKKADSGWRRREMRANERRAQATGKRELICPIGHWTKWDVLAYLKRQNIPVPHSSGADTGRNASGIDLASYELLWMHDNYPDDFKTLTRYFPYIEAVVWRRKFYGVSAG